MKINKLLLVLCTLMSSTLQADYGCMDNSRHLTECFDHKEYHLVQCNCPCWKYKTIANRNQCLKCRHYHDVEPLMVTQLNPSTAREVVASTSLPKDIVNDDLADLFGDIDWIDWHQRYE